MRFKSLSEPSLASMQDSVMSSEWSVEHDDEDIGVEGRHTGGINWGLRCLTVGTDASKVKLKPGQKIPWVKDHTVSVSTDNRQLHPALRHYFDGDGLESSFRNRGIHHGRKERSPRDTEGPAKKKKAGNKPRMSLGSSGSWDSIHSSLLDRLSFSSLNDIPGGLPEVRKPGRMGSGSPRGSSRIWGQGFDDFYES